MSLKSDISILKLQIYTKFIQKFCFFKIYDIIIMYHD